MAHQEVQLHLPRDESQEFIDECTEVTVHVNTLRVTVFRGRHTNNIKHTISITGGGFGFPDHGGARTMSGSLEINVDDANNKEYSVLEMYAKALRVAASLIDNWKV